MNKTVIETRKEIESGKPVVDVVKESLFKVDERNEELNVFLTVARDEALRKAKELDEKRDKAGVLFGVPIALKDMYMTKGIRTTAASKVLENYIPPYSATVVKKLEDAGAVIVGKTNQDAWAHGASGENSDFGPTKHPLNLNYVPGGSSSGSGVSVAAGMVPMAMGTDTGGSIRQPASFLGVVGFKPTYGRVSRYGVVAMASSLDSMGHFTNTVEDAALVLSVTAGADRKDATSSGSKPFKFKGFEKRGLKGIRIGIPSEYLEPIRNKEIKDNFEKVMKSLSNLGAELVEVKMPHTEHAISVYYIIQPAEVSSNLGRYDGVRYGNGRDSFGPEAKRRIMIGTYTLSSGYYDAYYKTALKVRTLVKEDFDKAFSQVDALVAPVSPTPPFKIGEKADDPLEMYLADVLTVPVNLAGLPGIAVPSGVTSEGLPMGIQVIGKQYDEEGIFPISYELEQAL